MNRENFQIYKTIHKQYLIKTKNFMQKKNVSYNQFLPLDLEGHQLFPPFQHRF